MFLLISILLSVIAILNLSSYGLPPTHDGEYHIMRIWQFHKVLLDGNLYPLWAPDFNNGFGVPLFNYVYPLPNYIGSILHLAGFSLINSYKLVMVIGSILGSLFMYLYVAQRRGRVSGLVSSVLYTFAPYHLLDIYVRGSVGEVMALGLFPGILWFFEKYINTKKYMYFVLTVLLIALLILSHNILAMIFFPLFILLELQAIFLNKNKKVIYIHLILVSFLGLGISCPFWFPAIVESSLVQGLQFSNPIDHFPVIYKLIYSSWGYGFSGDTTAGQMSFQIGIANLFVLCFSLVVIFFDKLKRAELIFYLVITFFSVFLITPFSSWLWINLPLINYVQFPWRVLSIVIFMCSIIAGTVITSSLFKNKMLKFGIVIFLLLISVILSINYIKAPFYHERLDSHYLSRDNFTNGTNSPGDAFNTIWVNSIPEEKPSKIELHGEGKVSNLSISSQNYKFQVDLNSNAHVKVNTAYFPYWNLKIDGRKTRIINDNGIISFNLTSGVHSVEIYIGSTEIRSISTMIMFICLLLLLSLPILSVAIIKKHYENWY